MGEDLRRVLGKYRDLAREIREKVAKEKALVEEALDWSDGLLKKGL
jgi:cell division protein ZapA (FtsZ GTPase activity inhibitor)